MISVTISFIIYIHFFHPLNSLTFALLALLPYPFLPSFAHPIDPTQTPAEIPDRQNDFILHILVSFLFSIEFSHIKQAKYCYHGALRQNPIDF